MPVVDRFCDWNASIILVFAALIFILLIVARSIYPNFYRYILYRMFVENFSGRKFSRPTEVSSIEAVTIIISLLSMSAMFFAVICYSGVAEINVEHGSEWKLALVILLSLSFFNQFVGLINLFSGMLFHMQEYAKSYNTLILDSERLLSILFLPLFLLCPFVPANVAVVLLWIAFVVFLSMTILRYVTIFFHLLKNNFLNHHSFLYFCTLEVLPILIIIEITF